MTLSPAPAAAVEEWTACPGCGHLVYIPRLSRALGVCPECGHHQRLGARERLHQVLDVGTFEPDPHPCKAGDPLGFVDSEPYPERLERARRRTGLADAALYGRGRIDGLPVIALAMDFAFLGGSMGSAIGESVTRMADLALSAGYPLVLVAASGGARMQEGCLSLMQMARTCQALNRLRRHGVPSICVLSDPTFGGVTASFATSADILVGEKGALIGFAGPRVIEAATHERLPAGFQTAEYLHDHGLLDRVEPRDALRPFVATVLRLLAQSEPASRVGVDPVVRDPARLRPNLTPYLTPYQTLRTARAITRPTTLDYVWMMCEEFVELHGDRRHGDDPAVVGGLASLGGTTVMLVGHQKGHDTQELVRRNFGMPHPEGYRKALRLMRLAEQYGLPVVTLVDTQGAAPGIGAEERGQAWAIAESIAGMADLGVPVVSTIIGEGGSGGALALAVANEVLMLEHACYSVISPESCSTILHKDPSRAEKMARALRITAPELLALGVVDGIVPEPEGGAQAAPAEAAAVLRDAILAALERLSGMAAQQLRDRRYARFGAMGVVVDE